MSRRLAPGGRELIIQLALDIADLRSAIADARQALTEAQQWNSRREPYDVDRYLNALRRALDATEGPLGAIAGRTQDELETLLQRRADRGTDLEERVAAIERRLAELTPNERPVRLVERG